ncbi:flavin monoamine oxidase family protein [Nostoc sp. UHCC 0251]|uniref:flavin monoamine oxidase family protein n=1 Tax=Nostoc sp. UHCC 0251 TaxID=3110240 RepID=UPI002B20CBE4|nr:FAD-dependent oxidoreductase [Nostoc sp. UHCC 0251]MEA5627586.1 FAD-dependent oxidoreductase [Nostoc sp. UHCC 0251]
MSKRVIVVGAGLAGLTAAYELTCAGFDVQLFEARERFGGRVQTVSLGAEQHGELGAEFVDDNHTALISYATQFNLKLEPAFKFPDDICYYIDGNFSTQKTLTAQQQASLNDLYEQLDQLLTQQADPAQTLAEWLTSHSTDPFACKVVRQQSYGLYAADPEAIGVGFFAYSGTSGDRNLRIRGGSSQLAMSFAHFLGDRIHLNTPVRRIQQQEQTISVSLETVQGQVEVFADWIVVTIPWSVLRHLSIEVPLTEAQREAIAHLSYGVSIKTLLQYSNRFWQQSSWGLVVGETPYQTVWESTVTQPGEAGILACTSSGTPSRNVAGHSVELAQQTVSTLKPKAPKAIATATHDWSADPWSQGSYCYFAPRDLKSWRSDLPYSAGRVIFAGEHSAPVEYCGYMEGAIRSGQRAAAQISAFVIT